MNFAPSLDRRSAVRLTGAVYTPSDVAEAVIRFATAGLPARRLRVLEPSVGDGAFLGQLTTLLPDQDYVAIDIDDAVVQKLRSNYQSWPAATTLHTDDFVQYACNAIESGAPKFDFVVGNPPFIRKHNFPVEFKVALKRLSDLVDYPLQDLKNSWASFLVASAALLVDDGVVAFVLPYELITVAYGHAVLNRMLGEFSRIDLFVSDQKAFPAIDQDAIIFVGKKGSCSAPGLFIQRIQQMSDLSRAIEHPLMLSDARPMALDLNAYLLDADMMPQLRRIQAELPTFSDVATSAPGIVTAANEFFILRDADVERFELREYVLPILKKQSIVDRSPVFSKADFEALARKEPCRFLYVKGEFADLSAPLQSYIAEGAKAALPDRYKCRNRKNWYEVPLVKTAPGFFFKRSHGFPRICVNEAEIYITDTAYGVHPKEGFTIRGICFSFYNSLTMLFAETNGRFYGGGVLELSPNELRTLPIVYHEPSDEEFAAFLEVARRAGNDPLPILDFGDAWLKQHPSVAEVDLEEIRKAWAAVRAHRLRHSSRAGVSDQASSS